MGFMFPQSRSDARSITESFNYSSASTTNTTTMPTIPITLRRKPSFHCMSSGIPDYFLAYGNKNDFQERMICNLWLLLLTGYVCYQFPSLVVVVWLVSPDFIMAQTKKSFGVDHTSEE
jgi:hypothetical protein